MYHGSFGLHGHFCILAMKKHDGSNLRPGKKALNERSPSLKSYQTTRLKMIKLSNSAHIHTCIYGQYATFKVLLRAVRCTVIWLRVTVAFWLLL